MANVPCTGESTIELPVSPNARREWSYNEMRELGIKTMGKRACLAQMKVAQALYCKRKDVVAVAPTGFGKTLAFFLALFMAVEDGLSEGVTIVTPLNALGEQNTAALKAMGVTAIAINGSTKSEETYKDVGRGKYRVVVISPELAAEKAFLSIIEDPAYQARQLYIVVDEAHCVSRWGRTFREDYLSVGNLRDFMPNTIPFCVVSATLAPPILRDVIALLGLRHNKLEKIILSNDRSNIALLVRPMAHSMSSYKDLAFLLPHPDDPIQPVKKFLVFVDSREVAEDIVDFFDRRLPPEHVGKILYYHASMTDAWRRDACEGLRSGRIWGLIVTDAFGMGMDLPDIEFIVQWSIPSDIDTLWQRFGRAARDFALSAIALLLVEKGELDLARTTAAIAASVRSKSKSK
ncbi:P-loop containing nucleoside triphosphate hydrolase protein, partial [Cylindrobasidium torrendii FP15055 ss-10]